MQMQDRLLRRLLGRRSGGNQVLSQPAHQQFDRPAKLVRLREAMIRTGNDMERLFRSNVAIQLFRLGHRNHLIPVAMNKNRGDAQSLGGMVSIVPLTVLKESKMNRNWGDGRRHLPETPPELDPCVPELPAQQRREVPDGTAKRQRRQARVFGCSQGGHKAAEA